MMKFFNFFAKKNTPLERRFELEKLVEFGTISKEEMLFIKKERATKEWEKEVKLLRGLKK